MSDLISRKELIDWLTSEIIMLKGINSDLGGAVSGVREMVKVMPSYISTESKRKRGKWQRRKDEDCWECSECHAVLENSDIGNHNFYYCYHCGADMMDICGYINLEKANYE